MFQPVYAITYQLQLEKLGSVKLNLITAQDWVMLVTDFQNITGGTLSGQNDSKFDAIFWFHATSVNAHDQTDTENQELEEGVTSKEYRLQVQEKLLTVHPLTVREPELKDVLGSLRVHVTEITVPVETRLQVDDADESVIVGAIVSFTATAAIHDATTACQELTTDQLKLMFHSKNEERFTQLNEIQEPHAFDQLKAIADPDESRISTLTESHASRVQLNIRLNP